MRNLLSAGGVRWSNGANRNRVYSNKIKMGEDADYALYLCEFTALSVFYSRPYPLPWLTHAVCEAQITNPINLTGPSSKTVNYVVEKDPPLGLLICDSLVFRLRSDSWLLHYFLVARAT